MKKISLLALVAAFALVGAGCTASFDVEDQIEESDDVVEETMDEAEDMDDEDVTEESEIFTLGYDEGTEVVYIGDSQGTLSTEYSGQQIVTGTFALDQNLSKTCLTLEQEELEKIPEATGEATEHYCLASVELLPEVEGEVILRIGKVEVEEIAFGKVWTLEVLQVMPDEEPVEEPVVEEVTE